MNKVITYSFEQDLIKELAEMIRREFGARGRDLSRIAIVFGGRRPALFLKRELAVRMKGSYFPPRFFSMDEFMGYVAGNGDPLARISDMDACFHLYGLISQKPRGILEGREKFYQFLPWAREILSLIEHLDLEDVTAEQLKRVRMSAAIGYDVPDNINSLIEQIAFLRNQFHAYLETRESFSRGRLYLEAARTVAVRNLREFETVIFANFFYLHRTEQQVVDSLFHRDKGILVFQGAERDWSVLRDIGQRLKIKIEPVGKGKRSPGLNLWAGFDTHSQAGLCRELLKKNEHLAETVVVLPEPSTIVPLLSEIGACTSGFNVSLGYPVKRCSFNSLFQQIFQAQLTRKEGNYYCRDYLRLLNHPFIKNLNLAGVDAACTRVIVHKLEEVLTGKESSSLAGLLFLDLNEIEESTELPKLVENALAGSGQPLTAKGIGPVLRELHDLLFRKWESPDTFREFCVRLDALISSLVKDSMMNLHPLNLTISEKIIQIKEELRRSEFVDEKFTSEEIFRIFLQKLEAEVVGFSGSPLKGLQILGLFETRSLNFRTVIFLDANESVLPRMQVHEPLIPREVMLALGLNRLEKEEEIQRYHFRRLIQGAKEVQLIYNGSEDKERSRFIEELVWEEQKKQKALDVLPVRRVRFQVEIPCGRRALPKSETVTDFLKTFTFSASSVDTYVHCPLRFYFQYVLGLREKEDLLEDPEGLDVGNFIHNLLEEAFKPVVGGRPEINDDFRRWFFSLMDQRFAEFFQRRMKSDSFLLERIIRFRLKNFLNCEEERMTRVDRLLGLETRFEQTLDFSAGRFKFVAKVDRLERTANGSLLIIDYKTGARSLKPKTLSKLEEMNPGSRQEVKKTMVSFQLPLYYELIRNSFKEEQNIITALYYLNDARLDFFPSLKKTEEIARIMEVCRDSLGRIVAQIIDPAVPFEPDEEDQGYCSNCPFYYFCR